MGPLQVVWPPPKDIENIRLTGDSKLAVFVIFLSLLAL